MTLEARITALAEAIGADIKALGSSGGASSLKIPFYKADSTLDTISLTASQELPFFKADGTQDNISLVT